MYSVSLVISFLIQVCIDVGDFENIFLKSNETPEYVQQLLQTQKAIREEFEVFSESCYTTLSEQGSEEEEKKKINFYRKISQEMQNLDWSSLAITKNFLDKLRNINKPSFSQWNYSK